MKLEKVSPVNLQPGMYVVGKYVPDAPTTHVQPMAHGLRVQRVVKLINDEGVTYGVQPIWMNNLGGEVVHYADRIEYLVIEL